MKQLRQRSICKRYIAIFNGYDYPHSEVLDTITGCIYENEPIEREGKFYSKKYMMGGFSSGDSYERNLFELYFMDCNEGIEIDPYTGNTVIKKYNAFF